MKIILEKGKSNNSYGKSVTTNLTLFQFIKFLQKCQDALLYVNLNETKKTYLLCVKIDFLQHLKLPTCFHFISLSLENSPLV